MKWKLPLLSTLGFMVLLAGGIFSPHSRAADILVTGANSNTVAEYTTGGTLMTSSFITGLSGPRGIAVDSSGDIFIANQTASQILEYNSTGTTLLKTITASVSFPMGIAVDTSNNLWVANLFGAVTEYNSSGTLLHSITLSQPSAVAVDTLGNVYAATFNGTVVQINAATATVTNPSYLTTGLTSVEGILTDSSNDLFVSGNGSNKVLEYNSGGTLMTTITSGLSNPDGMMIDPSTGDLYVTNFGNGAVSQYNSGGALLNGTFMSVSGGPSALVMQGVTSAPEPSRAVLLLAGLGLVVLRRGR